MKKPEDLRGHLEASVPCLKRNPENLHVFIEKGNVVSRLGGSMSFMYRYELNLIITDFTDHADTLFIPLLAWIAINQPEIMQNPEKQESDISFQAEIIDHDKSDISITIKLTESVIVTQKGNAYEANHIAEPALLDLGGPINWTMYVNGLNVQQV